MSILRVRHAPMPDSLNENEWQVLRAFFTKNRNSLFWKGKTTKPRYRLSNEPEEEQSILCVQYSGDGGLLKNGTLRFISKEEAIERLQEIHSSSSGVCKVVGLNSLVRQFGLRFHCNGIKQLAKDFLKSCPACQLHTFFPSISPPPRPIRSYGPFERIQADIVDMAPGKKRSFMTNNRSQHRYILVIKDCFSKFCWLIPTKTKSAHDCNQHETSFSCVRTAH